MNHRDARAGAGSSAATAILVAAIVGIGGFLLWAMWMARTEAPRSEALTRQAAIEARADDASWLVLKDAARRHLAAVRSDAPTLPDDELGDALIDYAQNGKRFFRTPRTDPTDRLAALKTAAAALNDPTGPVRCRAPIRSRDDPKCARYLKALVDVFGRDL
jgi:hypothetical protein